MAGPYFAEALLDKHFQGLYDALITRPDLDAFTKKVDEIRQEPLPQGFTEVDFFSVFTHPRTVQIGSQTRKVSLWQAAHEQSYDLAKEGTTQYQLWERMHALMKPDSRIAGTSEALRSRIAHPDNYQQSENTRAIKAAVHELRQLFEIKYKGKNFFLPLANLLKNQGVTVAMSPLADIHKARRHDILHELLRHVRRRTGNIDFGKIEQLIGDLKSFYHQDMPAVAFALNTTFAMPFQSIMSERQTDASAQQFIEENLSVFDINKEENLAYAFKDIRGKIESSPMNAQKVGVVIVLLSLYETHVGQAQVWKYLNQAEGSQKSIYQLVQGQAETTADLDHPIHALLQDMESYEPEEVAPQDSLAVASINDYLESSSPVALLQWILSPDPHGMSSNVTSLENFDTVIQKIINIQKEESAPVTWCDCFHTEHKNETTGQTASLYDIAIQHQFHGAPNGSEKNKIWVRMHQLMRPTIEHHMQYAFHNGEMNVFDTFYSCITLQRPHRIKATACAMRESMRVGTELGAWNFGRETRRADLQIAIRLNITAKPLTQQNIKDTIRKIEQLDAFTRNADMIDFFNAPCDTGSSKASLYERVAALSSGDDDQKNALVECVKQHMDPTKDTLTLKEFKAANNPSKRPVTSDSSNSPFSRTKPRGPQQAKSSSAGSNCSPAPKMYLAWGMIFVALTIIAGLTFTDDHQLMTDGVEKTGDWSSKMSDTAAQGTGMGVYILIGLAAGVFAAWMFWPAVGSTMSLSLPGRSSGQHTYSQLDRQMRNG